MNQINAKTCARQPLHKPHEFLPLEKRIAAGIFYKYKNRSRKQDSRPVLVLPCQLIDGALLHGRNCRVKIPHNCAERAQRIQHDALPKGKLRCIQEIAKYRKNQIAAQHRKCKITPIRQLERAAHKRQHRAGRKTQTRHIPKHAAVIRKPRQHRQRKIDQKQRRKKPIHRHNRKVYQAVEQRAPACPCDGSLCAVINVKHRSPDNKRYARFQKTTPQKLFCRIALPVTHQRGAGKHDKHRNGPIRQNIHKQTLPPHICIREHMHRTVAVHSNDAETRQNI